VRGYNGRESGCELLVERGVPAQSDDCQGLMVPFPMIMRREFSEGPAQMGFAEADDLIQTFFLDGPDEALRVRIAVRCLKWRLHGLEPSYLWLARASLAQAARVQKSTRARRADPSVRSGCLNGLSESATSNP